jgi:hypothetical protein
LRKANAPVPWDLSSCLFRKRSEQFDTIVISTCSMGEQRRFWYGGHTLLFQCPIQGKQWSWNSNIEINGMLNEVFLF